MTTGKSTERFHVLSNDVGEQCIWPTFVVVPDGWYVVLANSSQPDCADHVDATWRATLQPTDTANATDTSVR